MKEQQDAVEHHLDDVGGVRKLFNFLDVRGLDRADGFVGLLRQPGVGTHGQDGIGSARERDNPPKSKADEGCGQRVLFFNFTVPSEETVM